MRVLEMRDLLAGQFEPLPLDISMQYLRAQEAAGRVRFFENGTQATLGTR